VALTGTVFPVNIAVGPGVVRDTVAPTIATLIETGLAEQGEQLAVIVAMREIWFVESAVNEVVANPVVPSVVTVDAVSTAPPTTDKDKALPFSKPPEASKARTVIGNEVVPSAFSESGLGAVIKRLAI